jgi:RHS repeat-associated protein
VKYGTATLFVHGNVLQSTTDVTDQTGAERQDQIFYPWGQSWILHQLPDDGTFATMEPLTTTTGEETGITPNRDYSKSYGRWLSPDPGGLKVVSLEDPQTWNMYAYAGNNPTTNTDPDGETYKVCQTDANGNQSNCTDISDEQFGQFQQENKDTLTFTGNGNVLQNGTVIGSYDQTSVDPTPGLLAVGAGTQTAKTGIITSAIMIGVFATAYASTYAIPAVIAGLTALGDTGAVGSGAGLLNKIHHIFGDPGHNLAGLVQRFGSPAAAYAALEQATTAQVVAKGLTGQFQEVVNVGGTNVTVRGAVVDGVVRIGTAFR